MSPAAEPPPPRPAPDAAARWRLVLVTPGDRAPATTARLVAAALDGGVTAVLLREPQLEAEDRAALARELCAACAEHGAQLLVSRDPALALVCGTGGVHAGWGGPTVAELRAAAPGLLVSRSAHWPLQPEDLLADLLLLSPFRPTTRSLPRSLLTDEQVRSVLATPGLPPTAALGGLGIEDIAMLPAGLSGVAVIRAIADAPDPRAAAVQLAAAVAARVGRDGRFGPPAAPDAGRRPG
jgi:thiamine-phosphate pyrophosphorylase